ncbi:alpha/beta fold hydrolase [Sphingosinicella sp. CPCC 101087]|uniref:alpha/beta fold hydrolase n=1 Tax=Sphingosinicella sp. CPCC 101087 TaxID=2497754 RepID=UPI00101B72AD|nr:alpha/beta hydrolase [Sphingosinicella sp. CPCC 101087]
MGKVRLVPIDGLDIAIEESGTPDGTPVILLHGFPYDPRAFDALTPILHEARLRVIVPYLRGFGPTRFRGQGIMRSGQQGALGNDLHDLIRALDVRPILAGFDWGGRAACVAAALWPEAVRGLVAIGGCLIQDLSDPQRPAPPFVEHLAWHQYYLASARGRRALEERRDELCRYLWRQWSPSWRFEEEVFASSAGAFDNPDFAGVAWHSYAHRIGAAPGDPRYDSIERALTRRPDICVPTVLLHGGDSKLGSVSGERFSRLVESRILPNVGHNPPQEDPVSVARAVLDLAAIS